MNLGQRLGIAQRIAQASSLAAREGVVMSDRHYQQVDPSWGESGWNTRGRSNFAKTDSTDRSSIALSSTRTYKPARKVPLETATTIRALYDAGNISYRDLAAQFGCGFRCIGQIVNREGAYRFDP